MLATHIVDQPVSVLLSMVLQALLWVLFVLQVDIQPHDAEPA
jgi:hypothetical protein